MVDERALVAALRSRTLAAAVDVISGEQTDGPARSPLLAYARRNNNLTVTPHIPGLAVEAQRKAARFALDRLKQHFGLGGASEAWPRFSSPKSG